MVISKTLPIFIAVSVDVAVATDLSIVLYDSESAMQVLTKDSVTVSVDAVVYYRVSNATVSVANVENAHHSTRYEAACEDTS